MAVDIPDKEELIKKYSRYGCTISQLARDYSVSNPTIRVWFKKYNIERKSHKQASTECNSLKRLNVPSKDILIEEYINKEKTCYELTKEFGVGLQTIYQWLDLYDIQRRSISEAVKLNKKKLFSEIQFGKEEIIIILEKYNHNKIMVADYFNVSLSHIKKLIKQYNIETTYIEYKSKGEKDIFEYCKTLRPDLTWLSGDRKAINPYELDIYCPDLNIAFEYCGLYWHSEYFGDKKSNYHLNKFEKCKDKNIELITIFENDDINKVKNLIRKKLNLVKRIYARKTIIKEINSSIAAEFHRKYHLHEAIGASVNYGLFYNNELVLVASFAKSRFNKNYKWECTRCTTHSEFAVVGGVSKLFKYFYKQYPNESLITYADLRFGSGSVYEYCNMKLQKISPPNYWYFHKNTRKVYSRVAFQKHKLGEILENFDENKTEYQNMLLNGYDRIWDCGNAVYINNGIL